MKLKKIGSGRGVHLYLPVGFANDVDRKWLRFSTRMWGIKIIGPEKVCIIWINSTRKARAKWHIRSSRMCARVARPSQVFQFFSIYLFTQIKIISRILLLFLISVSFGESSKKLSTEGWLEIWMKLGLFSTSQYFKALKKQRSRVFRLGFVNRKCKQNHQRTKHCICVLLDRKHDLHRKFILYGVLQHVRCGSRKFVPEPTCLCAIVGYTIKIACDIMTFFKVHPNITCAGLFSCHGAEGGRCQSIIR